MKIKQIIKQIEKAKAEMTKLADILSDYPEREAELDDMFNILDDWVLLERWHNIQS